MTGQEPRIRRQIDGGMLSHPNSLARQKQRRQLRGSRWLSSYEPLLVRAFGE